METIQRKIVYSGWMTLVVLSFRLPDGRIMNREVLEHARATAVLPYDADRRMALLVRQFRAPVYATEGDTAFLEAIAGIIDDGNDADTARREAFEEAGLRIGQLEPIVIAWPSPGMMTEQVSLFLAPYRAADRVSAGGGLSEEHEDIEVVELPLAELAAMADTGRLSDMKTFALVQTLRLRRPALFGETR